MLGRIRIFNLIRFRDDHSFIGGEHQWQKKHFDWSDRLFVEVFLVWFFL